MSSVYFANCSFVQVRYEGQTTYVLKVLQVSEISNAIQLRRLNLELIQFIYQQHQQICIGLIGLEFYWNNTLIRFNLQLFIDLPQNKTNRMSSIRNEHNPQHAQTDKSNQNLVYQIDREKIANYLTKNIHHSNDPQRFSRQLDQELQNHLEKMQAQIQKEVKRKSIFKLIQDSSQKNRQQWRQKIQSRLQMSQKKRDKDTKQKVQKHAQFRQYRQDAAKQRFQQLKKKELLKALKKRKQYYDDFQQTLARVHQISRNTSENRFNHSSAETTVAKQKKILLQSQSHAHIMANASKAKVFQLPKKHQRQISLDPIEPRKSIFRQKQDALYVQKTVIDLQKIQQARKRKQKQTKKNIQKRHKIQNFATEMHQRKLANLKSEQDAWKKAVIQKDRSKSELVRRMKQEKQQKIGQVRRSLAHDPITQNNKQFPSVKISFRKQIKKKMDQFLKEEKANIINRMVRKQSK